MTDILSFHGYKIVAASDGQEGVARARELLPNLILMDIQMPNMDGLTACRILREDQSAKGLKIIELTSFVMQGDQEKFLAAGFDGYISKPISTRQLPSQIKQWFEVEGQR